MAIVSVVLAAVTVTVTETVDGVGVTVIASREVQSARCADTAAAPPRVPVTARAQLF